MNTMCDANLIHEIENGKRADPETQGLCLGQLMRGLNEVRETVSKLPTRQEMQEAIHAGLKNHIESCDAARDDKPEQEKEHNRLKLAGGKFGLEAEGKPGVLVGLFVGLGAGFGGFFLLLMAKAHVWAWVKSLGTP